MYEDDFLESDYEDRYTYQNDVDEEDRADYQDYLDAMDEQPESDEEDEQFEIVGIFFYNPFTDVLTRADGSVVADESDSPDIQYFSDGTPIPDEPTYSSANVSY